MAKAQYQITQNAILSDSKTEHMRYNVCMIEKTLKRNISTEKLESNDSI